MSNTIEIKKGASFELLPDVFDGEKFKHDLSAHANCKCWSREEEGKHDSDTSLLCFHTGSFEMTEYSEYYTRINLDWLTWRDFRQVIYLLAKYLKAPVHLKFTVQDLDSGENTRYKIEFDAMPNMTFEEIAKFI